jgi:hypothetical protein
VKSGPKEAMAGREKSELRGRRSENRCHSYHNSTTPCFFGEEFAAKGRKKSQKVLRVLEFFVANALLVAASAALGPLVVTFACSRLRCAKSGRGNIMTRQNHVVSELFALLMPACLRSVRFIRKGGITS